MFECTKNSKLGQVIPGQSLDTVAGNTFTTVHSNFLGYFLFPQPSLTKMHVASLIEFCVKVA